MTIKTRLIILLLILVMPRLSMGSYRDKASTGKPEKEINRIVTLAPALTEIVYALGSGDRLAGNTKFCNYPAKARSKQKIGGYLDVNLEILIKLKPDLIICYPEHLNRLKILKGKFEFLTVKHLTTKDILNSIQIIGKRLGTDTRAAELIRKIRKSLFQRGNLPNGAKVSPKVLLIADRDPDRLKTMYIIGTRGFLNEILELVGARNAYSGNIPYPSISVDSVSSMNPDIIIDFTFTKSKEAKEKIKRSWDRYQMIRAVRNRKIIFAEGDFWQKPGPRIGLIADELRRILY